MMLPDATIDRDSPVPFYFQLSELLEHEIVSGRWETGLRLPSELDLCSHFGVSRTTLRQALGRLEQEGLVSRHKGRGTFVDGTRPRSWLLQSSGGFFEEEVQRMGHRVTSRVRRAERGVLPAWACDALGLPTASTGLTLERVRSVDGLVAMYVVNHLPERFADAVISLEEDESLYQRLREQYGLEAAGGRRIVEALPSEELLAKLLEVPPRTPLLFVESVTWDGAGRPFDCYQTWLRTDRMKIEIDVVAGPPVVTLSGDRNWNAAP
jgi:GntR family transcriptional regulator